MENHKNAWNTVGPIAVTVALTIAGAWLTLPKSVSREEFSELKTAISSTQKNMEDIKFKLSDLSKDVSLLDDRLKTEKFEGFRKLPDGTYIQERPKP